MIRTSDRYIFRQIFLATLYAVVLLSFFLVLGTLFQEIRKLVVENRLPLLLVAKYALNVFPSSLIFTMPWGFMAAVLLVFQRLSADNELNSFKLAGLSLPRIAAPVFVIALLLSGLCWWINMRVVPAAERSNQAIEYYAVKTNPQSLIQPGTITSNIGNNFRVFVHSKEKDKVKSLHLYRLPDPNKNDGSEYIYAEEASLGVDPNSSRIKLMLNSAYIERIGENDELDVFVASAAPWKWDVTRKDKPDPASMTNEQINEFLLNPPETWDGKNRGKFFSKKIQRYSFACASLAFAFVAVPLGIGRKRREGSGGVLVALLLGAGYFVFSVLADKSDDPSRVTMLLWAPNVICVLIGCYLFHRARFR